MTESVSIDSGTASAPQITYFVVAAAWLSSIMMLGFALAGCYCLANMQFKQVGPVSGC